MYRKALISLVRPVASLIAVVFILMHPAGSTATAAQLTPQEISQFLANPTAILTANPNGGDQLASAVRDLVLSDPATLPVIINLLAQANRAQQSSMGAGLGQAALASLQTNPALIDQIQTALAASDVEAAIASYSSTTGNSITTATGGGGGGGVGGPILTLLPTGGGGGGGGTTGSSGGSGSSGSGLTGGGGGVSGGGGGSGDTSTGSQSVSPH